MSRGKGVRLTSAVRIRYSWNVPDDFTGTAKIRNEMAFFKNGLLHRVDGPAIKNINMEFKRERDFWLEGYVFKSKEDWFEALTVEEKMEALFNINEWR